MGFNRRKMEDQRRQVAEKEAAARRATDAQVLEDAERLIAAWNERQALRAPMIFSPTIGAAIKAGHWFLWVRCPACRTINAIDLRTLDPIPTRRSSRSMPRSTTTAIPSPARLNARSAARRTGRSENQDR
jgi:phage FluMu protein Com